MRMRRFVVVPSVAMPAVYPRVTGAPARAPWTACPWAAALWTVALWTAVGSKPGGIVRLLPMWGPRGLPHQIRQAAVSAMAAVAMLGAVAVAVAGCGGSRG